MQCLIEGIRVKNSFPRVPSSHVRMPLRERPPDFGVVRTNATPSSLPELGQVVEPAPALGSGGC
jgi:hypothetical protein